MRAHSYGSAVFDVKREFQDSKRKTRKLIAYIILSAIVFYIMRFVLQLNMSMMKNMIDSLIRGEPVVFNAEYVLEQSKENQVVAFLIGVYYFLERSYFSIKDYALELYIKVRSIVFD